MNKVKVQILLLFLLTAGVSHARQIAVAVGQSYDQGEAWISTGTREPTDTLSLSTGLKISVAPAYSGPVCLAIGCYTAYSALVPLPGSYSSVVYRYNSGLKVELQTFTCEDADMCTTTTTTNNPDTVWDASTVFPDSTAPLDSQFVFDFSDIHNTSKVPARTCFASRQETAFGSMMTGVTPGHNSIIYAVPADRERHMKIQVSNYHVLTIPGAFPIPNRYLDSLCVRWAVDSAGDRIFSTSVQTRRMPDVGSEKSASSRGRFLVRIPADRALRLPRREVFTLTGAAMSISPCDRRAGVYVVDKGK